MGLYVKIVPSEFANASRDKREIMVAKELGNDVIVVAKSKKRINENSNLDGWNVHCRSTRLLGQNRLLSLSRFISIFTWAKYVRTLRADFISGHDLMGLLIAWLSTIFQFFKNPAIIIYDAHEFETGLNTDLNRFSKWFIINLERFLMKRATLSIVVYHSIACEVKKLHRLSVAPIVIRNVPSYCEIDEAVCKQRRYELLALMGSNPDNNTFIVMYHGNLIKERGIENLILAASKMQNIQVVILGNGQDTLYFKSLIDLVEKEHVISRVLFHPAVPSEILWQYVGAVDVGVCTLLHTCPNHYYSLPNKLFENIQSETPVIGSDFPEISHIIKTYNIGMTCNPHDVENIVSAIEEIRCNKEQYFIFKKNLKIAKKELCWENEKIILMRALEEFTSMNQ